MKEQDDLNNAGEPWRGYIECMEQHGGGPVVAILERDPQDGKRWEYACYTPGYLGVNGAALGAFWEKSGRWFMTWSRPLDVEEWIKERERDGARLVFRVRDSSDANEVSSPKDRSEA